jgi:hypothetical protein
MLPAGVFARLISFGIFPALRGAADPAVTYRLLDA